MTNDYEIRVRRVLSHMHDNPGGDLSLDALAEVAAMSRFHWHRVFAAMTGETCAQAARRIRAFRAAAWLVQTDWPIATVAARAGYDNAQSFARLFRQQYGMTPLAFRCAGRIDQKPQTLNTGANAMLPHDIRDLSDIRLVGLTHSGPYYEISRSFEQVGVVFGGQKFWPEAKGMMAIYFDSPEEVPPQDLRSFAGVWVSESFALPDSLEEYILLGGRHLVATFKGPYADLPGAWADTYRNALPQSGATPADRPPFESYLNSMLDTAPEDLLTEICVPLAD